MRYRALVYLPKPSEVNVYACNAPTRAAGRDGFRRTHSWQGGNII